MEWRAAHRAWVGDQLLGFLIGVLSQTRADEAYIHMVGIHPERRAAGLARALYARFFALAREKHRSVISATTSPGNHGSIAFHTAAGFSTSLETDPETRRSRVRFCQRLQ